MSRLMKLMGRRGRSYSLLTVLGLAVTVSLGCVLYGAVSYFEEVREKTTLNALDAIASGDLPRAAVLLRKASEDGDPAAIEYLTWLEARRGNYARALEYARSCSLNGSRLCLEVMGDLALLGFGDAQGPKAALSFFEQAVASEKSGEMRQAFYRDMLERALPLCRDLPSRLALVREGLRVGAPRARLAMGDILFLGDGLTRNPIEAVDMWQAARESGVSAATTRLAGAYWHGYGVNKDEKLALSLYREAADHGDPVACYSLALIALRDIPDPRIPDSHYREALELFDRAAAAQYGPASSALGILSFTAHPDDPTVQTAAAQWFNSAYKLMDSTGSILYSLMLATGIGVAADKERAFTILYDEAQNGSDVAGDLLNALSHGDDPQILLHQTLAVCRQILMGEVFFREGAAEAAAYYADESLNLAYQYGVGAGESKVTVRTGTADGSQVMSHEEVVAATRRLPQRVVNPRTYRVDGQYLLLPSIGGVIVQSAPSTGARMFEVSSQPPRPPLPPVPPGYTGDPLKIEYAF